MPPSEGNAATPEELRAEVSPHDSKLETLYVRRFTTVAMLTRSRI